MLKVSCAGVLSSSAVALLCLAISAPPIRADESMPADAASLSTGHVLACDTAEEVEAVLDSRAGDIATRVSTVNDRFGKQSCNIVTAIFYRGNEAKTVLVPDGIVRIIKVDLVGYRAGGAWMRMATPMAQYVGVLEKATSV
jgi:hypothetical protein